MKGKIKASSTHLLQLLLLVVVLFLLSHLVTVQPSNDLVTLVNDRLLVTLADLVLQLLVVNSALKCTIGA